MFSGIGYDSATGEFIIRNPWGVENGQNWLTEFEATMSDLNGVNGTLFVANGSTGATPSAVEGPSLTVTSAGSLTDVPTETISRPDRQRRRRPERFDL